MSRTVPRRRASRGERRPRTSRRTAPPPVPAFVEDPADDAPDESGDAGTPVVHEPTADPDPERDPAAGEQVGDPEPVREEVVPGPTAAEIRVKVTPEDETRHPRWAIAAWGAVVAAGLASLVAALVPVGPSWLDMAGAVAVVTAYSWALAARTGGRPVVFGGLGLLLGVAVVVTDEPYLRTGAAVMTCVVAAVLAVMVTVPAERFLRAARECCLAVLVAAVGALAVVGFDPVISLVRFEYVTLGMALVGVLVLVYRLGAGWHGLGRRGLVGVLVGGALLAVLLLYAELLRRYGPPGLVSSLLDGVRWSRDNLGAFPRPIEAVLGVPALAWGVHMRARRRQGWWLCALGAAGTTAVANSLVNPAISLLECGLSVGYGLVVGLLIGYAVIRVDIALTGGSARGRRAGGATEPVRPEPPRSAPLL